MKSLKIIGVFGALALSGQVVACAPAPESDAKSSESSVTGVIPGASLGSRNVSATAAYLPSRSLANLKLLGALVAPIDELAGRIDTGLGTKEPDGRLTVEEILAVEQPGMIEQLLPTERLALPALWKLFETVMDAPGEVTLPALDAILATEVSDVATTPVRPANITLNSLSSQLQRAASHLEVVHNSDNDPSTVTDADLDAALAAPGDFLPPELGQFKTLKGIFLDRAGTKLAAKVRVTLPVAAPYSPTAILPLGPASLGLSKSIEYNETRTMDVAKGDLVTSLVGHVTQKVVLTLPSTHKVLILDDGTTNETFAVSGTLEAEAGVKTVEVWTEGARVGSFRMKVPQLRALETNLDLTKYIDYKFVLDDMTGTVLDYDPVSSSGTQTGDGASAVFGCSFTHSKDGYGYVSDAILAGVATPAFNVATGRYVLPTSDGDVTVQLYPEGVLTVSRADNWTERAIYRGHKFVLPAGTDLQFSFDPATGTATVTRPDATIIFSAKLTGSLRTG